MNPRSLPEPTASIVVRAKRLEYRLIPASVSGALTLVFLHEGLGSAALWKTIPEQWAAATGCAALVYSRYGNGFSQILAEDRSVSYMCDEAIEVLPHLLDLLGIDQAILIGHSDGASIALIYAGEIGERLRGVVAEAPHVFVEEVSIETIRQARKAYETAGLRARMSRYHAEVDRTFYGWNDVWLRPEFRSWSIEASLPKIHVPMLLIQGADDAYGTLAQLDAIRRLARKSRADTLHLASCGHDPLRDRPETVSPAALAFIKTLVS